MFWDLVQKPSFEVGQTVSIVGKSLGHGLDIWGLDPGDPVEITKAMGPREAQTYLRRKGWDVKITEPLYLVKTVGWIQTMEEMIFLESELAPQKLAWQLPRPHKITITYAVITPESAEEGDYAETGWEDQEGVDVEPDEIDTDEGLTAVDKAVKYLSDEGARYEGGADWFTRFEEDYFMGSTTEYNYHLVNFTPEEMKEVQDMMNPHHTGSLKLSWEIRETPDTLVGKKVKFREDPALLHEIGLSDLSLTNTIFTIEGLFNDTFSDAALNDNLRNAGADISEEDEARLRVQWRGTRQVLEIYAEHPAWYEYYFVPANQWERYLYEVR